MKKYATILLWIFAIIIVFGGAYSFYNANKSENLIQKTTENASEDAPSADIETNQQEQPRPEAPEITLKDLNGNIVNLSDFRGKVVVLNFWASWCPPCKEEMPELEAASQEFEKGDDAVLLTIDLTDGVRETVEKATAYIADNGLTLRVLFDTEGLAATAYGIQNIPTTFIIDKAGKVYDYIIGPTTKDALVNYVATLKDETVVTENQTIVPEYKKITPSDAKVQLASDSSIILLDVRTIEEYNEVHIPSSILIPVDQLETEATSQLPDKDSTIFVYCRSGNRSATASKLLVDMGYTNVYDLGGIKDWPYETQSGN